MKNQKGVTLTILIATVVVMAIIAGSISYNSLSSMKMNKYYNMCSDIELLDEKISLYYLQNKELPILEAKDVNGIIKDYSEDNVNYNPNNSNTLYKIDLSKLENLSLKNTEYYIDSRSHTIYSLHGIKIEGKIYHTVPLRL